ncbi:hypothetical protein BJX68DRAFT_241852 [Aspergillus pseudodeflectus]|uniref:Zn(2)-C6 fungal-type domain-containing protein n=1 Tax=Aspergillus pseudodeflectus TaxID=176178 RepID=A0ABR4JZR0_9EURO
MSADAQRPRPKHACETCKTRKKKCNKGVPACSYCILKDLECRYVPLRPRRVYATPDTSDSSHTATYREGIGAETVYDQTLSDTARAQVAASRHTVYRPRFESLDDVHIEVQRIIHSTGEFVDDLTSLYFRTLHVHLPIISRSRFQRSILATGSAPGPDFSILLLTICLNSYIPSPGHRVQEGGVAGITRRRLYLSTKALLAQVQGSMQPSVPLIQASLLLAMYEYASGRADAALATVAGCARMAYAAGIHTSRRDIVDAASRLEAAEAWNLWWGVVICERTFMCEAAAPEQPLTTAFPTGDASLPVDRQMLDQGDLLDPDLVPNMPLLSSLTEPNVGGFARAAQACCLLDRIFEAMGIAEINTRLPRLESLDKSLQSFLSLILSRGPAKSWHHCTALAMTLRSLFILHTHILSIPRETRCISSRSLDEWKQSSLAALDTATTMVLDMANWHYDVLPPDRPSDISPMQIYVVHATLEHLRTRVHGGDSGSAPVWPTTAEGDLGRYLGRIQFQWVSS